VTCRSQHSGACCRSRRRKIKSSRTSEIAGCCSLSAPQCPCASGVISAVSDFNSIIALPRTRHRGPNARIRNSTFLCTSSIARFPANKIPKLFFVPSARRNAFPVESARELILCGAFQAGTACNPRYSIRSGRTHTRTPARRWRHDNAIR
jgi:hypothetical protein